MSPRFDYSPSSVSTAIEVFPKDDYEFVVGEPKAFSKTNAQGQPSFGVRFALTVGKGDYQGKRTIHSVYLQSEGAQSMAKQFQMAVLGYGKGATEEKRFNTDWGTKDWSLDFDALSTGDAWREMTGRRVVGSLDVGINTNTGDEQQNFKQWSPLVRSES